MIMLDKIIKTQLEKLEVAKVSQYNEEKHRYLFKKISGLNIELNKTYIIKLDKQLLNKDINTFLVNNWNGGKIPLFNIIKGKVVQILGTMYKISGIYLDEHYNIIEGQSWEGWFPLEKLEIINSLEEE